MGNLIPSAQIYCEPKTKVCLKKKKTKTLKCKIERHGFHPRVRKIPWRRTWQPIPVFSPGKSQGQRSLAGYSPWCYEEMDMTEQLTLFRGTPV